MAENTAVDDNVPFEFDGIQLPVTEIETNFSHRLADRVYPYIDGAGHDWTGRGPYQCTVTVPLINTIKLGLYPGVFNQIRESAASGEIKRIRHPDVGDYDARVTEFGWTLTGRRRAGVFARIAFVESLADPDQPTQLEYKTGSASDLADAVDSGFGSLGISFPNGMGGIAGVVEAAIKLPATLAAEVSAKWQEVANEVGRMRQTLDTAVEMASGLPFQERDAIVGAVERIVLERNMNDLWFVATSNAKAALKQGKKTKTHVTERDISLPTLSFELGTNLGALVDLNPNLLGPPLVPKGTKVLYVP